MSLKEAKVGDVVKEYLWITSVQTMPTKNNKKYQSITAKDTEGIEYKLTHFEPLIEKGSYVALCEVAVDSYENTNSYKLLNAQRDEKYGIENFMPKPHVDEKQAWSSITKLVKTIERPTVIKVVCRVLNREKDKFLKYPLNSMGAFARTSGILEATLKLMMLTETSNKLYKVDKDLMMAGAALYYIGKTHTITSYYEPTEADILVGDGLSAAQQLYDAYLSLKAEDPSIDDEDVTQLAHILMSRFKGQDYHNAEAAVLRNLDEANRLADEITESLNRAEDGNVVITPSGKKVYKPKKREKKEVA